MGPQPVTQRRTGDTAAQSKACGDELGAPEVARANKAGKPGVFLYEGDMANSPDEMPLHERTQHRKQTGGVRSDRAARKL